MKVYMICGKARHGKDTVASMIQKIYEEKNLKILNLQYTTYMKEYAKNIVSWDGNDETKPRTLLQELGNTIRNEIDPLFFINRMIEDIKVYSYYFDAITVSDVRMKREIDIPKEKLNNVISVNVVRPNFDNGLSDKEKKHLTEVDLDNYENYDFKIINDGSLEDLEKEVRKMVDYES